MCGGGGISTAISCMGVSMSRDCRRFSMLRASTAGSVWGSGDNLKHSDISSNAAFKISVISGTVVKMSQQ